MKTFMTLMILTLSGLAYGRTVLECDNKAIQVTEQCQSYRTVDCYSISRQLDINNLEIVAYFEKSGMLRSNNEGRFEALYVQQEDNGYAVKTMANGLSVVIKLKRVGNGLRLEAYNYEERPTAHGVQIVLSPILGDWNFQNCK